MSRRICVVTGTRAEYGLLQGLMQEFKQSADVILQVAVTGTHLSPRFGETWRTIVADGFDIDAKVDMGLTDDSPSGVARSMGLALSGFGEAFARLAPDLVVVFGDRYEMLAAAEAAMLARIPMAHLHGGEATEGLIDEAIRHSLTKMAHLHFTAAEDYRRRVIQLGEAPDRVYNVGSMGVDCIARVALLDRPALEAALGLPDGARFALVTYHPVTLRGDDPARAVGELAAALDLFPNLNVVVTGVNADPGREAVAAAIEAWRHRSGGRVACFDSLGQVRYLSALRWSEVVIGNSSSGIVEAPVFKIPTINLGPRQQGRVRADTVIDCPEQRDAIVAALSRALDPEFRRKAAAAPYPFGEPGAADRVARILSSIPLDGLLMKRFYDLPVVS